MPLSEHQKEIINNSIDFLLDFPTDKRDNLIASSFSLFVALISPTIGKDSAHYWIWECLRRPNLHLQGLEKQNRDPITIGEVQQYILDLIVNRLSKASEEAKVPFEDLLWESESILKMLPVEDADKPFKTILAAVDGGYNPWQLPSLPNKIFTQELRIEETEEEIDIEDEDDEEQETIIINRDAFVDLSITCDQTSFKKSAFVRELPHSFNSDEAEDRFMSGVMVKAQKVALDVAAKYALHYIRTGDDEYDYDSDSDTEDEEMGELSEETQHVLTHTYYFKELNAQRLALSEVDNLDRNELANLTDGACIDLMINKLCSLNEIRGLTKEEKIIASHPVYYHLLRTEKIKITDIFHLTEQRQRFLIQPPIANLVQVDKLSFASAKKLPLLVKDILTSSLYANYFIMNNVDWSEFSNFLPHHTELLLNPCFAPLIINHIIKIHKVAQLNPAQITLITHEDHAAILKWMEQKILHIDTVAECDQDTFHICYIMAIGKRLFNLQMKTPYLLDGIIDTFEKIKDDIENSARILSFPTKVFHDGVLQELIYLLKLDLEKKLVKQVDPSFADPIYRKFISYLEYVLDDKIENCPEGLKNLLSMASEIDRYIDNEQLSSSPPRKVMRYSDKEFPQILGVNDKLTFFQGTPHQGEAQPDIYLKNFCNRLMAYGALLPTPQEKPELMKNACFHF